MADQPVVRKSLRVEFAEVPAPPGAPPVVQLAANCAFAALDKNKALLIGGYCNGTSLSQVVEYDIVTKQWSVTNPLPSKRSDCPAVNAGGTIVLFGGYNDNVVLGDTLLLKTGSSTTVPPTPAQPEKGGKDAAAALSTTIDVKTLNWETLDTPVHPPARRLHSMTSMTTSHGTHVVYVFGGFSGETRLNDLWAFHVEDSQWRLVEASGSIPLPRDCASLVADPSNNRLILFGGFTSSRVNDLYTFDIETSTWIALSVPNPPSPRFACFGTCCNGYAIFGLGLDSKGPSAQTFQLNLTEMKWSLVQFEGDELEPRIYFSFAPMDHGKKLLVFGGTNERKYSNVLWELEFDKTEPVVAAKGGKK